ncbi:FUSC family protein [Flavisolibacter tropicus]|uniref:Integral membrane bound transporter domain-containing protein n=1 Tax=Flavisolibacter tropicus TaxID=1492898 RepID=A0A172TUN0_9BACT|nr:FUSC family protein [Flavisolibacter tropicus]ANE50740.1 hypothetical protein SY85_09760 [Flavisolibacter tropicus]
MFRQLLEFKPSNRKWDFPILAGLCVGIPILAGYFTGLSNEGKLASLAGLVILYAQTSSIAATMITLMACSFGIMVSFLVGSLFSFNPYVAALALGVFAFMIHWALYYLGLARPPGNFFFIMIASVAICMPFNLQALPGRIGWIGIGTIISCMLGLAYSVLFIKKMHAAQPVTANTKNKYMNLIESITFGLFVGSALLVAHLLELENPYWVPTSCAAVMQGVSTRHIWQRSVQRIAGTFIGLCATWVILLLQPSLLVICFSIIFLQVIVEWLVVRNYGIAVIFISILTIFLAESGNNLISHPTGLIIARFYDILIGSVIGAIGGWVLYNEQLYYAARRQVRKARVILSRRR